MASQEYDARALERHRLSAVAKQWRSSPLALTPARQRVAQAPAALKLIEGRLVRPSEESS
jgi:hypothetical protein